SAAVALKCVELLRDDDTSKERKALTENLTVFRDALDKEAGVVVDSSHPAVSILVRNAIALQRLTDFLGKKGVFAMGYCHPVLPEGEARLTMRVTARHKPTDLERAARAIGEGMNTLGIRR